MPIVRLVIEAFEYQHILSNFEIALTRDRFTQVDLKRRIANWLATPSAQRRYGIGSPNCPFPFQAFVDKYSEVATADALADLEKLVRLSGQTLTAGGLPTGFSPLAYLPRNLRVSSASLGALGEGIGGYYLEQIQGFDGIARPILVSPDLLFEDPSTRRLVLAEVKTTIHRRIQVPLKEAAIDLLDVLAKNRFIRSKRCICAAVGVVIREIITSQLTCEVHFLKMEET